MDRVIIIAVVKRYQNELHADAIISLTFNVSLPPFVSGQTSREVLLFMICNMNKPPWPVLQ
jgi:hypothetical protein